MKDQAYHWTEGKSHKVGRMALVDGRPHFVGPQWLMQELHTNRLTFVDEIRLTEYHGDKTLAKQEART